VDSNTCRQIQRPVDATIVFAVRSFSSGYYEYENGKLAYAPEAEWTAVKGFVKFANRAIVIEFDGTADKQRVEIPYRIVEAMIICTRQASLTLTLWEAPRFFHVKDPFLVELMASLSIGKRNNVAPRTRLVQLAGGSGSHRETLVQSLVYQICVSPVEFDLMSRRLHERAIVTLHYHDLLVLPSYQQKALAMAKKDFSNIVLMYSNIIPFSVLYQMEALVRNGFLPPWTVQRLLEKTRGRLEAVRGSRTRSAPEVRCQCVLIIAIANRATLTKSYPVTARAIKRLFSQIPFPGPDVNAEVFDAEDIWTYIEENAKEPQAPFTKDFISVCETVVFRQMSLYLPIAGEGALESHNGSQGEHHTNWNDSSWSRARSEESHFATFS
jgi:hypothetical protein